MGAEEGGPGKSDRVGMGMTPAAVSSFARQPRRLATHSLPWSGFFFLVVPPPPTGNNVVLLPSWEGGGLSLWLRVFEKRQPKAVNFAPLISHFFSHGG